MTITDVSISRLYPRVFASQDPRMCLQRALQFQSGRRWTSEVIFHRKWMRLDIISFPFHARCVAAESVYIIASISLHSYHNIMPRKRHFPHIISRFSHMYIQSHDHKCTAQDSKRLEVRWLNITIDICMICWELVDNDLNILDISKIQENDQRSTFQLSNNGSFYNVDIY